MKKNASTIGRGDFLFNMFYYEYFIFQHLRVIFLQSYKRHAYNTIIKSLCLLTYVQDNDNNFECALSFYIRIFMGDRYLFNVLKLKIIISNVTNVHITSL